MDETKLLHVKTEKEKEKKSSTGPQMNCSSKSILIAPSCLLVHAGVLSRQTEDHRKHGHGHETSKPAAAARQSQAVRGGVKLKEGGVLSSSSHRVHSIRVAAQESETKCVSAL